MNKSIHQSIKTVILAISLISAFASTNNYAAAEPEKNNDELLLALVSKTCVDYLISDDLEDDEKEKHLAACECLLKANANPNLTDAWGNSLLNIAIDSLQDAPIIELLLTYKANINPEGSWEQHPLVQTVRKGIQEETVNALLNAGAYVDSESIIAYLAQEAQGPSFDYSNLPSTFLPPRPSLQSCLAKHALSQFTCKYRHQTLSKIIAEITLLPAALWTLVADYIPVNEQSKN